MGSTPGTTPPPGRGQLTRTVILRAGIAFIDDNGARDLTMRRLGGRLGVEAMALYHYFGGKEELLDGIVDQVIDDLGSDPQVLMKGASSWQDYLQRLAHGVRRMALEHPEVFPLIATRPNSAPWVRPPLRSVRWLENFLSSLKEWGFDDAAAAAAYRSYTSFLLGQLLLEVSAQGVSIGPTDPNDPDDPRATAQPGDDIDPTEFPTVVRMKAELARDLGLPEFEKALEALLDRLAATLPQVDG
ncbi:MULTISPECIES: TetR/AcrR family transcriptional regulator [unclassified Rhodococcus (in: high G+C Gram-positive bacteria)]|uniref:TetR/AcrR family transcriptional regulator n=1 Tax=unclassified Rhodococcus (in: high G+C Gram-positive bacteria) TaxID=192944 RepID=UPI000A5C34B9|nr:MULTISPECIES: TetR/AcrR family transcriptional regulator [unclassified Rhodococcus (in: high G+C Gram-positive bacteria)]MDQ1203354.1 AcrR family transcriptional regulator [Rhodococcus sp. SORGH_AS_0303]